MKTMHLLLTDEEYAQIQEVAAADVRKPNSWVKNLIINELRRHRENQADTAQAKKI